MKYVKILADKKNTQVAKAIIAAQSEMAEHTVDRLHDGANFLLTLRENVRLGDAVKACSVPVDNSDPEDIITELFYRMGNVARAVVAVPEVKSAVVKVFAADNPAAELADLLLPKKQKIEKKLEDQIQAILNKGRSESNNSKWTPAPSSFTLDDEYIPDTWIWQKLTLKQLPEEWSDQTFDFNDSNSILAQLISFELNNFNPMKHVFESPSYMSARLFSSLEEHGFKRYYIDLRETSGNKYFVWAKFNKGHRPVFVLPRKLSFKKS